MHFLTSVSITSNVDYWFERLFVVMTAILFQMILDKIVVDVTTNMPGLKTNKIFTNKIILFIVTSNGSYDENKDLVCDLLCHAVINFVIGVYCNKSHVLVRSKQRLLYVFVPFYVKCVCVACNVASALCSE